MPCCLSACWLSPPQRKESAVLLTAVALAAGHNTGEVQRKYCLTPEDENQTSAPGCPDVSLPSGVTRRGQFQGLPNNMGSCGPGLASYLKHTPHQAGCPSRGPRSPPVPLGSTFTGFSKPHPAPGSITPSKGRACASHERRKRWRKPEGGARLCSRGSPSSADTPRLTEARMYRNISSTPHPRQGLLGR